MPTENRKVMKLTTKDINYNWKRTRMCIRKYLGGTRRSENLKGLRKNAGEKVQFTFTNETEKEYYYEELSTEGRAQFMDRLTGK